MKHALNDAHINIFCQGLKKKPPLNSSRVSLNYSWTPGPYLSHMYEA